MRTRALGGASLLANNPALMGRVVEESPARMEDMGRELLKSGMLDWALDDMPRFGIKRVEDRMAGRMALVIWNQLRHGVASEEARDLGVPSALEDIQTGDLALPTKWALPMIRRIYPAIFDAPMFATQPMPGPLAYAFFMDFKREVDGTDFRAVAPFTAFLAGAVAAAATTFTMKMSQNSGAIGYGPYQVVAGQVMTVGLGTANAEQLTVSAVAVAGNTATVTVTSGAAHTHAVGDVVYVNAPALTAEAAVPGKAKLSLTRQSVTAQKWMMAATWSTEAMEDAKAQLNLDIEAEMVNNLAIEIGRELFGTIIGDIIQGATAGNTTLPALGASAIQDYRYLAVQPLYTAEAGIYTRRVHDADTILAGVDLAANISKQDQFHITPADQDSTLAELGVTHLGTFQGKFQLYKSLFLPGNLAIMFKRPTDWLHAGYVYMPYIPLSPMPLVYAGYSTSTGNYTNTDEWTRNIRTRAGRLMTVSDEYALLTQG